MHASYNTGVTVVHPLLGYVHKDLALGPSIIVFSLLQCRAHYNSSQLGKIYMRQLDRTTILSLRSNPQDLPSPILSSSTAYKIRSYNKILHIDSLQQHSTIAILSLSLSLQQLYLYVFGSSTITVHSKTLTLPSLGLPCMRV
jgi:hypothetical protein